MGGYNNNNNNNNNNKIADEKTGFVLVWFVFMIYQPL